MNLEFHCSEPKNFQNGDPVRAFSYREYSVRPHSHAFYEVNIVKAGNGTHCIENGRVPVRRGDVFVIPPGVIHAYVETSGLEVHHILLQRAFLEQNREESHAVNGFLQLTEIEPFLRSSFSKAMFLHLTPGQMEQLETDLTQIDDSAMASGEGCIPLKKHAAWKILYWFSGLLNEQLKAIERKPEHKYEGQILRTLEYMHQHYEEKITIETLCRYTYLSRSTLLRSFQDLCGVSPVEYLTDYRCKMAIGLLDQENYSKTEVAHRCGFYDLSHMERCLKKRKDAN